MVNRDQSLVETPFVRCPGCAESENRCGLLGARGQTEMCGMKIHVGFSMQVCELFSEL